MVAGDKIRAAIKAAQQRILSEALILVQETIDNYIQDLELYIGKTSGASGYSNSDLTWAPLVTTEGQDQKFWYETGNVASHIISKVEVDGNSIRAMAGLPSDAPGYQEALWNEFGWSPHGSSKIIRRALFVPLSEHHLTELNALLAEKIATVRIKIRVKA